MELCSGTLDDYFNGRYHGRKFTSEKEILRQLTQGLAHLHKNNIIHRDLKPTNCLIYIPEGVADKPQMKLADFGISKLLNINQEDLTNSHLSNPSGTRGWMAPEAYNQKRYDFKVDTWALGLLFGYTLSGGKHPYGNDPDKRSVLIKEKKEMMMVKQDLIEPYSDNHEAFE